jgi:hypothetical protein
MNVGGDDWTLAEILESLFLILKQTAKSWHSALNNLVNLMETTGQVVVAMNFQSKASTECWQSANQIVPQIWLLA